MEHASQRHGSPVGPGVDGFIGILIACRLNFVDPFNSPIHTHPGGLEEIDNFCITTLRILSDLERNRQTGPLSIDSLARVDIGLFIGKNLMPQYYVNEISRHPCSLMDHQVKQTTHLELMASCVAGGLVQTYKHHCLMYPSLPRRHIICRF